MPEDGTEREELSSAELFLPDGSFQPTASLAAARRRHLAMLIEGFGGVLVAGGAGPGGALASTEVYLPWEDRFEPAGSLLAPRERLAGVMLDDGIAVAIGGLNSSGVQAGCGIFPTPRISVAATDSRAAAAVSGSGFPIAVAFGLRRGSTQINDRLLVPGLATDSSAQFPTTSFMNTLSQDIGPTFTLRAASGTNGFAEKSFTVRNTTSTAFDNGQLPPPPDLGGFPTVFQSAPFTVGVRVTASGTTPNVSGTVRILDGTTVIGSATVSGSATLATRDGKLFRSRDAGQSLASRGVPRRCDVCAVVFAEPDRERGRPHSERRDFDESDRSPDARTVSSCLLRLPRSRHAGERSAADGHGHVAKGRHSGGLRHAVFEFRGSSASFPFLPQTQEPFTTYTCAYGGDTVYNSASRDRSITVGPARTSLTFTTVPGTYTFGQAVTIAIQLNFPSSLFLPDTMRQARLGFVNSSGQNFSPFFVAGDTITLTPSSDGRATGPRPSCCRSGLRILRELRRRRRLQSTLGLTTTG